MKQEKIYTNTADELDRLGALRMPLSPLPPVNEIIDESYKRRKLEYDKLLREFYALKKLKTEIPDYQRELTPMETAARADYIKRLSYYLEARTVYTRENDGFIETIDMVRAKLEAMEKEFYQPETEHEKRLTALMIERCELLNSREFDCPLRSKFDSNEEFNEASARHEQVKERYEKCFDEITLLQKKVPNRTHQWVEIFDERSKFKELDDEYADLFTKAMRNAKV